MHHYTQILCTTASKHLQKKLPIAHFYEHIILSNESKVKLGIIWVNRI